MSQEKKEVLKTKICCACKKEKEIKSFYKNKMMPLGYESRCKVCKQNKLKCNGRGEYGKKAGRPQLKNTPQLWNVRKEDWIETYEFLKSIGYDLNKNIHEQFCERYDLKPRKRMYEKSIQYTPKDLGLV